MRRCALPLFLLLFAFCAVKGQGDRGPAYLRLYRQAERFYSSANATSYTDSLALTAYLQVIMILQNKTVDNYILLDSYLKGGILEMSSGGTREALTLFSQAIALGETVNHPPLPDSLLFKPYLYAGSCQYDLYDLDSSLYYYKLAENILDAHPDLGESERLYNKEGVLYYESGDYRRSIQYFSKALAIVKSHRPADTYLIVNYQNNIASSLLKLGEYQRAIDIYNSLLPYHNYRDELLYNIGTACLDAGQPAEAIHYLEMVEKKSQAGYNNTARAWLSLHKYDAASACLRLALFEHEKAKRPQKSQDLGNTFKYTGDLLMALDSPARAIRYYQRAIIQLDKDFDDSTVEHNPTSFWGMHSSFLLFDALVAKAKAFYALGNARSDTHELIDAFAAYAAALSLARHVEKMYYSDDARLFLVRKVDAAYKETVALGYRLFQLLRDASWLEKTFAYMEAGKASVLQARLGDPGPQTLKGRAREIFIEQKRKKAEASKLNIRLAAAADGQMVTQIQTRIRDLEIQISGLQEKLDRFPEYYRQKFISNNIGIATIREQVLDQDAALLSYYYTDQQLFCFYVTRERSGCIESPWTKGMEENISILRNGLDNGDGAADRRAIGEATRSLSQALIAEVYERVKDKGRLIVIPYNNISYIPFEILESPSDGRLLLNSFSISYAYSANFLNKAVSAPLGEYQVLALAPFARPGGTLPVLRSSSLEVNGLPGKVLQNDQAGKDQFIRWLPTYPIVHLATHAVVSDEDPMRSYIEFYSRAKTEADTLHRLFEQEIYHLDMDSTALIIISACETGSGQLIHGEGIISLSRAFSYAGCKSVITSLWKADDAATAFIVQRIHHYLQKGEPKDRALQLAKMDYLAAPEIEARYKTPFFWAHLVLIGDIRPVARRPRTPWLIIGIALILLFATGGWMILKKRRARLPAPGMVSERSKF